VRAIDRWFPRVFSYQEPNSLVNRMRRRRGRFVRSLLEELAGRDQVSILDLGGTYAFWATTGLLDPKRFRITLLNLEPEAVPPDVPGFQSVAGNAQDLPYADGSFDVVFSNSVIEHMGSGDGRRRMAEEVRRVGRRYIVQTPSVWFPLEPHCRIPFFQFLPRIVRAGLIRSFDINYFPRKATLRECLEVVDTTMMMSQREFQALFPGARIRREYLAGLIKSYTAYDGWTRQAP
jgi:hypothetical protein